MNINLSWINSVSMFCMHWSPYLTMWIVSSKCHLSFINIFLIATSNCADNKLSTWLSKMMFLISMLWHYCTCVYEIFSTTRTLRRTTAYVYSHTCMRKCSPWFMISWIILTMHAHMSDSLTVYIYLTYWSTCTSIFDIVHNVSLCRPHDIIYMNLCSYSYIIMIIPHPHYRFHPHLISFTWQIWHYSLSNRQIQ